jgi:hypothetical protein
LCKERAEWKKITENPQWVVMPVKEEEEFSFIGLAFRSTDALLSK